MSRKQTVTVANGRCQQKDQLGPSASSGGALKSASCDSASASGQSSHLQGYRLIEMSILGDALAWLSCPECHMHEVKLTQKRTNGLAVEGRLMCEGCGASKDIDFSNKLSTKVMDVNLRVVSAMRSSGVSYEKLLFLFSSLGSPFFCRQSYNNLLTTVMDACEEEAQEVMKSAADRVRQKNGVDENGIAYQLHYDKLNGFCMCYRFMIALAIVSTPDRL